MMKGEVISYGSRGDPVVRPEDGGKLVVLTTYDAKPPIGTTIDFMMVRTGKRVNQGSLQVPKGGHTDTNHPLYTQLANIQALWDGEFVQHMTPEAKKTFPESLQKIRDAYARGDLETSAQEANENYRWALRGSETAEVNGPGFNYFPMFRQFQSLEATIRSSIKQHSS